MGVPLLVADEVAGVLVMQRQTPNTFGESDVSLASSLTAPIILVIGRHSAPKRGGPNSFVGTSLVPGRAIGPAVVLPAPSATPTSETAALHALEFDLVVAAQRLGHAGATVVRAIENFRLVAVALREQVAVGARGDVLSALERTPYHGASGIKDLTALVGERHREVNDLWGFLVTDMQHRLSLCGAVLAVPVLGTFMALEAVARGAAAVVVADKVEPGACEVLAAAKLPVITNVAELVVSVRSGEILEVDADRGRVRVLDRSGAATPL
jgi:phosphohistidine swiveling domain-containing protein